MAEVKRHHLAVRGELHPRAKHPDAVRDEAIRRVVDDKVPPKVVAADLNVPPGALRTWLRRAGCRIQWVRA